MLTNAISLNKILGQERKKKLSSTLEYHLFLDFRRYYTMDGSVKNKNLFNEDFLRNQLVDFSLEQAMIFAYTDAEGKMPKILKDKLLLKQGEGLSSRYHMILRKLALRDLNLYRIQVLAGGGKIISLRDDFFPLRLDEYKAFIEFFDLITPNLLLLDELQQYFEEIDMDSVILPLVSANFCILERFDELVNEGDVLSKKWKNPAFKDVIFKKVSKEVQNILLKDDNAISQLFDNIFQQLNYTKIIHEPYERVLPKLIKGSHKNLFPIVKEKVEGKLPFLNYLYLEEEEKQPDEVREVKKQKIDVNVLLDKTRDQSYTFNGLFGDFKLILLDIMFSQILQELFKEYEFYHKKIVTMAPAIVEGDVKALEENPNAQMKDFWKIGLVLYKLYFYLGMYKSIVGYREFYFKPEYADFCKDLIPFTEGCDLYWSLMKVMGDFELEIEGQESYKMDFEKFPKDGILKARIKRSVTEWYPYRRCVKREHLVCWDVQERRSKLEEKEGFFWHVERKGLL